MPGACSRATASLISVALSSVSGFNPSSAAPRGIHLCRAMSRCSGQASRSMTRHSVAGWGTWFSRERAEIHGRDVLLDLPDKAWILDDGGIGHGLGAPISSLVHGQPEVFAAVWAYVETHDLIPAWPRAATRPANVRD